MSLPISYSESINFRFQHVLFNQLKKLSEKTEWLRGPAFLASSVSSLGYLISRTSSIAELAFHSLILFLCSATNSEKRLCANIMIKRVPNQFVNLFAIPPTFIFDIISIVSDSKFYINFRASIALVTIRHLEAGTINTEEHTRDCNEAFGRLK